MGVGDVLQGAGFTPSPEKGFPWGKLSKISDF